MRIPGVWCPFHGRKRSDTSSRIGVAIAASCQCGDMRCGRSVHGSPNNALPDTGRYRSTLNKVSEARPCRGILPTGRTALTWGLPVAALSGALSGFAARFTIQPWRGSGPFAPRRKRHCRPLRRAAHTGFHRLPDCAGSGCGVPSLAALHHAGQRRADHVTQDPAPIRSKDKPECAAAPRSSCSGSCS